MKRTFGYAATTKDAAQRSLRTFYEAVSIGILLKLRICELLKVHSRKDLICYFKKSSDVQNCIPKDFMSERKLSAICVKPGTLEEQSVIR